MVRIYISDKIIKMHAQYIVNQSKIKNKITKLMDEKFIKFLENTSSQTFARQHKDFCSYMKNEIKIAKKGIYKNIFTGDVEFLNEKNNEINQKFPLVIDKMKDEKKMEFDKKNYSYSELWSSVMGYKKFQKNGLTLSDEETTIYSDSFDIDSFEGTWGAYAYIMAINIKVCPYCNKNYIEPLYTNKGKVRADIDHFWPQSRYPWLAISLYNMVPCCKFCNSSLKGEINFTYENNYNPFSNCDIKKAYKFTYLPNSYKGMINECEFIIEIAYDDTNSNYKKIKKNNEIFHIKELYNYHKTIIATLIKKRYIYSDIYVEYILRQYPFLFNNREELWKTLLLDEGNENINNTSFGKLREDILEELGFYNINTS